VHWRRKNQVHTLSRTSIIFYDNNVEFLHILIVRFAELYRNMSPSHDEVLSLSDISVLIRSQENPKTSKGGQK
jgi:hypothetical protein